MGHKLIMQKETYALRGVCFEVYREKGCGFLESVYQECMEAELDLQKISFAAQPRLRLSYKGQELKSEFQPDLICFDSLVIELKAVRELVDEHRAQVHNYLRATKLRVGLLVNFGHFPGVEIERIVV